MSDITAIVSGAADSFPYLLDELRREFPDAAVERLGADIAAVSAPGLTAAALARTCVERPLVFPRHVTEEVARLDQSADLAAITAAAVAAVADRDVSRDLAVQVWVSDGVESHLKPSDIARAITDGLGRTGHRVFRSDQDEVLSCCVTSSAVVLGLNWTSDSLSDWPGGRVRLGRNSKQVSRSEFKLEELFKIYPLDLPERGRAVDFGASPGGWTRILREHGLAVWSVDTGDLAPSLVRDRNVRHERMTAGEFLRTNRMSFDLFVNDMRMDPKLSCELMVEAARWLNRDGLAVVTLKTGSRKVLKTVETCLAILDRRYNLLFARQLHHNRHELTVVLRKK